MEDPVITASEAAQILGVSLRTAQNWIEKNAIASWKTPGGHRRVRRSDILALRDRNTFSGVEGLRIALVLGNSHESASNLASSLYAMSGVKVFMETSIFAALLNMGNMLPDMLVLDLLHADAQRLSLIRHALTEPLLGNMTVWVVTSLAPQDVVALVGVGSARLNVMRSAVFRSITGSDEIHGAQSVTAADLMCGELLAASPADEAERLKAVQRTGLLDTRREGAFDEIVELASSMIGAPFCTLSLVTRHRQWFKAVVGLSLAETPRGWMFGNTASMSNALVYVEDAEAVPELASNPLVCEEPGIRFIAGAPVTDHEGYVLGSLCVMDIVPRHIRADQQYALRTLARLASDRINLRMIRRQTSRRRSRAAVVGTSDIQLAISAARV